MKKEFKVFILLEKILNALNNSRLEYIKAVIVSTPQDLALLDVKRGIQMFDKTGVKILGLIDNMSFFKGDDGKRKRKRKTEDRKSVV